MDDDAAAAVQRCAAAVTRLRAGGAVGLTAVADDLARLPASAPDRAVLAASLLTGAGRQPGLTAERLRGLDRIFVIAEEHPPDWPAWPGTRSLARMLVQAVIGSDHGAYDAHQMLDAVDDLTARLSDEQRQSLPFSIGSAP